MSLRYASLRDVPAHLLRESAHGVAEQQKELKRAKYGNKIVFEDGHKFDSAFEAQRYRELKNSEMAGVISDLAVHPEYGLHVNGKRIGAYIGDFSYFWGERFVLEDVKSKVTKTPLYEWKRKHLELEYQITVTEIERNKRRRA